MPTDSAESIPVEAATLETFEWSPRAPHLYSRAEVARQTGEYKAVVPARIATWTPQVSAKQSADIEDATRHLVDFDNQVHHFLGTKDPAFAPMTAILLRTESTSSSQIERLTASARQIALAEIAEGERANARAIVGNVRAMESALRLADDIGSHSILAMHRALMEHQPGVRPIDIGQFRTEQVWIGKGDAGPRDAEFVAPHHDQIPHAMADLVEFVARDDIPVLIQVAVAHAQFETIHPFADGNGRTGRALVHSVLRGKGLIRSSTLPLSAGLLVNQGRYFNALSAFRAGDAGPIVREFASAARIAALTGSALVESLASVLERSRAQLGAVRSDATAWKVLPLLVSQPAVNTQYLIDVLGLGEMAALRALSTLSKYGVLEEVTGKSRGRVWQHPGIFEVLDSYAEKIRRMSIRA